MHIVGPIMCSATMVVHPSGLRPIKVDRLHGDISISIEVHTRTWESHGHWGVIRVARRHVSDQFAVGRQRRGGRDLLQGRKRSWLHRNRRRIRHRHQPCLLYSQLSSRKSSGKLFFSIKHHGRTDLLRVSRYTFRNVSSLGSLNPPVSVKTYMSC